MRWHRSLLALLSLPLAGQVKDFPEPAIRAHIAFLADGLMEGRGTGHRGGALTARYLETQLQGLGLQPVGGSYRQDVAMAGIRIQAGSQIRFGSGAKAWTLKPGRETAFHLSAPAEALRFEGEAVFVGHGIKAWDGSRDDFKGMNLKGKLLIGLLGERRDTLQRSPACGPENYYSRWTYKFEEAARQGAAGMLLIHTVKGASYGWEVIESGWLGERFVSAASKETPRLIGWLSEGAARKLLAQAGQDLDRLVASAEDPTFRPVPLGLPAEAHVKASIHRVTDANIAAMVPGTDPEAAKEAVIFSAHWDHLGPSPDGSCFHGAVDNATACAAVLAMAAQAARQPAPRTRIFFFPCAEEQGLIGTEAWVKAPRWPLDRTVAVINLESLNVLGPTRDIGLMGAREAGLWDLSVQAAREVGLVPAPPRLDRAGVYFRSDHFPFIKAGVPSFSPGISFDGGWDYVGDREAIQQKATAFNREHYHRPSDQYDPAWDLRGLLQQLRFAWRLGELLAEGRQRPVVNSLLAGR